jgi:hypothetical protein
MSAAQMKLLIGNFVGGMKKVPRKIQERQIAYFANAVVKGLGLPVLSKS